MTVPAGRVFMLRLADVRRRIHRQLDTARSVAYGTHEVFHLCGALRWLDAHPGATTADLTRWREGLRVIGQARKDALEKRLARVKRIAPRYDDERLTGEQFVTAVQQAAPKGYQDDVELEARLARMRAAELAPVGTSTGPSKEVAMTAQVDERAATETRSRKWGMSTGSITEGIRAEDDLSSWSPEEIGRARALCDAATRGPWAQPLAEEPRALTTEAEPGTSLLALDNDRMAIFDGTVDASFVVAARSLLPAALLQIEELHRRINNAETREREGVRYTEIAEIVSWLRREADFCLPASAGALRAAADRIEHGTMEIEGPCRPRRIDYDEWMGYKFIAPGVRLVWQRGDVGVLTFEPGALVPEEVHERDEAGVVIDGAITIQPMMAMGLHALPDGYVSWWRIDAGERHTMTAGPDGAVVGVRWVGPAKPPEVSP